MAFDPGLLWSRARRTRYLANRDHGRACYGAGAATGPMIMTAVMHAGHPWQRGYMIVGGAQLALAGAFAMTAGWWPKTGGTSEGSEDATSAPMRATLREPAVWLGIVTF